MPPILSTSHCKFNGAHSCAHARKIIPLASIHLFTKQITNTFIVCIIVYPKLVQIVFTGFWYGHYKGFPSINNIFMCALFFLVCFFDFHRTLFHRLAGACVNPGSIFSNSLFVHSLVCPITHSFLDGYQPNLIQHFPQVCSTCHTIFSLKKTRT